MMTQFSRFKSKNNKTGVLLWDGMRKTLLAFMRASEILIAT